MNELLEELQELLILFQITLFIGLPICSVIWAIVMNNL